ncbi:MAG: hypothetical protein Tsb0020_41070 [Haliangiales bacterium]
MRALKYLTAIPLSGLLVLGACGDDGGPSNPDASPPDAMATIDAEVPNADAGPADMLFAEIAGYDQAGGDWAAMPGFPGIVEYTGHGATHRQVFSNSTFNDDLSALADGAIIVKENRTGTDGADLAALTVMKRDAGTWIYARFMPDGSYDIYGTTEDLNGMGCVTPACHGDTDGTGGDELFLNNHAVAAKATFEDLYNPTDAADKYDASADYTGFGDADPQEYFSAENGHGPGGFDWERVFINSIAEADEDALADGSIIIKEERTGDVDGDGSASTLEFLTIMERMDAASQTWLWSKVSVDDGKVKFAGQDASAACANGACHGNDDAANGSGADKVFSNGAAN